jgi:peptide chain release factor subunit 1
MVQVAAPDRDGLRRLAEIRIDRPLVLSLYLDLEPSQFAVPRARASEVTSLLDQAERRARELHDELGHDERAELERSVERAREFLEGDLDADGAHGVALFVSEPAGLFEPLKLPRGVGTRVTIDRAPVIGPLAGIERRERWCVALVSRRDARIFRGSPEGLSEREALRDEVHGQHDQGGWSQARYQRHVEKEKDDHLRRTCEVLLRHFEREPFERLVIGGSSEMAADLEGKLHQYLAERLAGRIDVDVETADADQVLESAAPLLDKLEDERERDALERLGDPSRGAQGLLDTLEALNERRVETLVFTEDYDEPGTLCPQCGWLGPEGPRQCPADGTELVGTDNVLEPAIELALQQSAEVMPFRRDGQDGGSTEDRPTYAELDKRGGIGALLRF